MASRLKDKKPNRQRTGQDIVGSEFESERRDEVRVRYLTGNEACAYGAIYAGCRFYAGYPITPSSEIMETMARELPKVGGVFIQMEDELASISAVIGAVWAGAKAMTATSGPGFSLMMENIGYAAMTETPCVIVDVQRAGPGTGQATRVGSGDILQVKWGSHGDYEIIALSPSSAQEMYDFTIDAFNLAEKYRVPVFVMSDECIGHMREKVNLHQNLEIVPRPGPSEEPPFGSPAVGRVTPMPSFGQRRKLLVTGSTHDQWGRRRTSSPDAHEAMVSWICRKIRDRVDEIVRVEDFLCDDAEMVVVAYGFTARSARRAVRLARQRGLKTGLFRLITLWPFPEKVFQKICGAKRAILVAEMNQGQISREVERCLGRRVETYFKTRGEVIKPEEILDRLEAIK